MGKQPNSRLRQLVETRVADVAFRSTADVQMTIHRARVMIGVTLCERVIARSRHRWVTGDGRSEHFVLIALSDPHSHLLILTITFITHLCTPAESRNRTG